MIWGFSPLSSCDNVLFKIVITGQSFLVMQGLSMATRKKSFLMAVIQVLVFDLCV